MTRLQHVVSDSARKCYREKTAGVLVVLPPPMNLEGLLEVGWAFCAGGMPILDSTDVSVMIQGCV